MSDLASHNTRIPFAEVYRSRFMYRCAHVQHVAINFKQNPIPLIYFYIRESHAPEPDINHKGKKCKKVSSDANRQHVPHKIGDFPAETCENFESRFDRGALVLPNDEGLRLRPSTCDKFSMKTTTEGWVSGGMGANRAELRYNGVLVTVLKDCWRVCKLWRAIDSWVLPHAILPR